MITKEMIASGIAKQLIKFVVDPNMESGTVCRIGDEWFYFGGLEAEGMSPDEYVSNVPMTDIVDEIFDTLQDFKLEDEAFKDECDYYESILSEWHDLIKEKLE